MKKIIYILLLAAFALLPLSTYGSRAVQRDLHDFERLTSVMRGDCHSSRYYRSYPHSRDGIRVVIQTRAGRIAYQRDLSHRRMMELELETELEMARRSEAALEWEAYKAKVKAERLAARAAEKAAEAAERAEAAAKKAEKAAEAAENAGK